MHDPLSAWGERRRRPRIEDGLDAAKSYPLEVLLLVAQQARGRAPGAPGGVDGMRGHLRSSYAPLTRLMRTG